MKIFVAGKGGREHALVCALNDSPSKPTVIAAPGSDAIASVARRESLHTVDEMVAFMVNEAVDLCVVGEESYLAQGLADSCKRSGIAVWGPVQLSARLESSKLFAKEFLIRHGIPTGSHLRVESAEAARRAITTFPTVLKFDGLAAGKGVAVCTDIRMVDDFLDMVFTRRQFGDGAVFVEEYLTGPEVSIICAVCDGDVWMFPPARDYKRLGDGDAGPNTGGMGAVASSSLLPPELLQTIERDLVKPVARALVADGMDYRGFLYFGIMLTPDGPKVLEFNCRFGDPEAQAVLPLIAGDFAAFLDSAAHGKMDRTLISISNDWSVCVVKASRGYPASSSKGEPIYGLDSHGAGRVYHAGTRLAADGKTFEVHGGRVLSVSCRAPDRFTAVQRAYTAASLIHFDGEQMRSDIGISHF